MGDTMATKKTKSTQSTQSQADVMSRVQVPLVALVGDLGALIGEVVGGAQVDSLWVTRSAGATHYEVEGGDGTMLSITVLRREI